MLRTAKMMGMMGTVSRKTKSSDGPGLAVGVAHPPHSAPVTQTTRERRPACVASTRSGAAGCRLGAQSAAPRPGGAPETRGGGPGVPGTREEARGGGRERRGNFSDPLRTAGAIPAVQLCYYNSTTSSRSVVLVVTVLLYNVQYSTVYTSTYMGTWYIPLRTWRVPVPIHSTVLVYL